MERYRDFWDVTEAALHSAARQLDIEASAVQLEGLMQTYLFPSAFLDAIVALEVLKGVPLAILSNGSPKMLESAVRHNAMESYLAEVISVDYPIIILDAWQHVGVALKRECWPSNSCTDFDRCDEMSTPTSLIKATASVRTGAGCVPAENTS